MIIIIEPHELDSVLIDYNLVDFPSRVFFLHFSTHNTIAERNAYTMGQQIFIKILCCFSAIDWFVSNIVNAKSTAISIINVKHKTFAANIRKV